MDKVFQCVFYLFLIIILVKLSQFAYRVLRERRYMKELAQSGMPYIDKMDGYQFEIYLQALFQQLGYKPQVTKKSGDFGADLVMKGKEKIVIQAKRYGIHRVEVIHMDGDSYRMKHRKSVFSAEV
ncbi:restriction endonuclease [Priestia megaterium]|uniref:restriction endonuclease n=1 Tax=Priestia megaterium TaxID=1404 RepID=UPI0039C1ED54